MSAPLDPDHPAAPPGAELDEPEPEGGAWITDESPSCNVCGEDVDCEPVSCRDGVVTAHAGCIADLCSRALPVGVALEGVIQTPKLVRAFVVRVPVTDDAEAVVSSLARVAARTGAEVLCLAEGEDVSALDAEEMAELGWIRVPSGPLVK